MNLWNNEDWWAVWIGLVIFALSLGVIGPDPLGWSVATNVWAEWQPAEGKPPPLAAVSKNYAHLPGIVSLLGTFVFLLAVLGVGAWVLGYKLRRFLAGFTVLFALGYSCWVLGHFAYLAATPDKQGSLGISWSLGLTGEAGYLLALAAGLVVGNLLPRLAGTMQEANRPEWFIKTAIVIMGAGLGVQAAGALELAQAILFRGLAAIIEAYLIYWALVYFVARRFFGFSREWAAPLASGISICGVSAAIATGGAIRARPIVPVMVSSLVAVFSVVELLVLPFLAGAFLSGEPLVAGAWMGLAVKTDGAAVASGAITDALVRSRAAEAGIVYQPDWVLMTASTVKIFIDVFIGVWAFLLALVWVYFIDPKPGEKVAAREIWQRFPKFVLGYVVTFAVMLALALAVPELAGALKQATAQSNVYRQLFFVLTFFAIGLSSNFKKLWEEGIGRLALVYLVCLFGFVIWIGLAISWLFFQGVYPPLASGG